MLRTKGLTARQLWLLSDSETGVESGSAGSPPLFVFLLVSNWFLFQIEIIYCRIETIKWRHQLVNQTKWPRPKTPLALWTVFLYEINEKKTRPEPGQETVH